MTTTIHKRGLRISGFACTAALLAALGLACLPTVAQADELDEQLLQQEGTPLEGLSGNDELETQGQVLLTASTVTEGDDLVDGQQGSLGLEESGSDEQSIELLSAGVPDEQLASEELDVDIVLDEDLSGTYVIQTGVATNKVLDAAGKSPKAGANVTSWTYNGGDNQKWDVVADEEEEGWYRIYSHGSDETLALGFSSSSQSVQLCDADGSDAQLWAFVQDGSWYNLINRAAKGCMLDIAANSSKDGANAILYACDESAANRRYHLVDPNPQVEAGETGLEGAYSFVLPDQSLVVDVSGASTSDGANVLLWTSNGKKNQQFYLEPVEEGFYAVWVVSSGKVLDVSGSSIMPGANVLQWTYKASDNQKWAAYRQADGTIILVNKATGLMLGIAEAAEGANVAGAQLRGASPFALQRVSLLAEGIYRITPRTTTEVALDVKGASTGTAGLLLWTEKGSLNQRYELVSAGDTDTWRIRTGSSGGWLTIQDGSVVQTGTGDDPVSPENTWIATFRGGWYGLLNEATGLALDMKGGSTKSSTQIIAWTPNGKDSQHFTFTAASLLSEGFYGFQDSSGKWLEAKGSGSSKSLVLSGGSSAAGQCFKLAKSGASFAIKDSSGLGIVASGVSSEGVSAQAISLGLSSSTASQWTVGIADGGRVTLVLAGSNYGLASVDGDVTLATLGGGAATTWKATVKSNTADVKDRIAQVAQHFATHSKHGYSQQCRDYTGKETITLSDGSKVTITSGDVDCSEMVRQCINAALGKTAISYLDTRCEDSELRANGFVRIAYNANDVQRGDILWRSGHTAVALGDGTQAEACMDENGSIYGPNKGDNTGSEVAINKLRTDGYWTYIYRYVG